MTLIEKADAQALLESAQFKDGHLIIPGWCSTICPFAFFNRKEITILTLPTTLSAIGRSAFEGTGIRTIVSPLNVRYISERAFYNTSLQLVVFNNKIERINDLAFFNNPLTILNIPDNTIVASNAFDECTSLQAQSIRAKMSVDKFFRKSHQLRIATRVTFLASMYAYGKKVGNTSTPNFVAELSSHTKRKRNEITSISETSVIEQLKQENVELRAHVESLRNHIFYGSSPSSHLSFNGPLAYRLITAIELWRAICMYL